MPLGTNVGSVFFDIKANQSAFKKEIKGAAGQAERPKEVIQRSEQFYPGLYF